LQTNYLYKKQLPMAFASSSVQQPHQNTAKPALSVNDTAAPLLAALVLSVYAAQKSKKQLRKLKRTAIASLLKFKINAGISRFKSLFSKNPPAELSTQTILYILLGIAVIILLFVSWPAAIVLLLLGILLILLTR